MIRNTMTNTTVFADHVLRAIGSGELDKLAGPEFQNLDRLLGEALSRLRNVPDAWQAVIRVRTRPADYGPPGQPLRSMAGALEDIDATLGFVARGNVYKFLAFIEDAVDGLNRRRFTAAIAACRAIFETSAVLQYWTRKLGPQIEALTSLTPSSLTASVKSDSQQRIETFKLVLDTMSALRAQPQLSKWNWLVFTGDASVEKSKELPKGMEQINVLTAIDKLAFSRQYGARTPRVFYDALCDCVHPNRGSFMLFMETCETTETLWKPLLRARPTQQEATLVALTLMAVPLQELIPIGISLIDELLASHEKIIALRRGLKAYL